MAFKPMHYFRKHQKVILACITIGAMFLFIVGDAIMGARGSGGPGGGRRGGIVNWFKTKFGAGYEDQVARVGGQSLDPEAMVEILHARNAAAVLVDYVFREGQGRYHADVLGFKQEEYQDQTRRENKYREIMSRSPDLLERRDSWSRTLCSSAYPSLQLRGQAFVPADPGAIVEFQYWKKKADSLGITLTNSLVLQDLIKLGINQVNEQELAEYVRARSAGRGVPGMPVKLDNVLTIIGDEIRAHLARQVLQPDRTVSLTPADLWQSYVNLKTTLNVGILPVKVEDYIDRVAEPTAEEVQAYYDKYKRETPDPYSETPGFKISSLYRIGVMYADMKETMPARKYYNAWVRFLDTLAPMTTLAAMVREYDLKKEFSYKITHPFVEFRWPVGAAGKWYRLYPAHLDQASGAALVARLGAGLARINALAPLDLSAISLHGEMAPDNMNQTVAAASLLGNLSGGLPAAVASLAPMRSGTLNVHRSFDSIAPALLDEHYEKKGLELLEKDFAQLTRDLADYGKRYGEWRGKVLRSGAVADKPPYFNESKKQTLSDYLTQFAASRGLIYKETKDLRSRTDLLHEPQERVLNEYIKPLYFEESIKKSRDQDERVKNFLLGSDQATGFEGLRSTKKKAFEAGDTIGYKPASKQAALHWIAEMTESRTPPLAECRAQVVRAWKLEKARAVAEEAAQKIVRTVKDAPPLDNERILLDAKGYTIGQKIASFQEPANKAFAAGPVFEPAPTPEVIDGEPGDLVERCLSELKQKGDMTVIANRGKSAFYLIYLRDRSEPKASSPIDVEAFHQEAIRPSFIRQITVQLPGYQPLPFRTFAMLEKVTDQRKGWQKYLRELTNYDPEHAKHYIERVKRDRY